MQLRKRGYEHAVEIFNELKKQDGAFQPLETDLNDWGLPDAEGRRKTEGGSGRSSCKHSLVLKIMD
jgi:hypothetical protein